MTSSASFQPPVPEGLAINPKAVQGCEEVVLIQDGSGQVLSFHWTQATEYNVTPERLRDRGLDSLFAPVATAPYLERIRRVLTTLAPERFACYFHCGDQTLLLDWVMSPVLVPNGSPTLVTVVGRLISAPDSTAIASCDLLPQELPLPPAAQRGLTADRYQKLQTQIASNIRRTLDRPTIWQQTVTGVGKALDVSGCVVCPYEPEAATVTVVAEYRQEAVPSLLGQALQVVDTPSLEQTLKTLKPVSALRSGMFGSVEPQSLLVVPTCYQDQPNGLILLHQCDRPRLWSDAELEFMQEVADQVGTAIAHATLVADSQALAAELQRVNKSFVQKHRELEEARQQAEDASRLKSEFLAKTSHELRTPLNGMIGFLKLIKEGMADDPIEQAEFINESYNSAIHLLNIINDILDIAKIEAGTLEIEMSPVKLKELLSDAEGFTRSQVYQKHLSFEIQNPPTDDEIILYGNYKRLLQVMLNLVGNAIKFTHEGGITISVEVIKKKVVLHNQELPGFVKVRVADTGIGVSLDMQDRLFQSFSQVDGSRTRQYEGTGLGLAISQKLVEAMGGEVNFYSLGEGLGSTVTFTVPLFQEPIMISSQS